MQALEHQAEQAPDKTRDAWNVFQLWTGSRDEERFRAAYLGHYPDRETFGQELLIGLGAYARLEKMPDWMQAYVRFDAAAVVADFERAGQFYVYDIPENGGTFVFDGYS